ncbi:MAG: indolepyruvate oxidoreductase subunit beta [Chloroflexota bacterium]|nr:indolepyruvate oxidoreductase subunit beta [Chloroflexota bacterium]
MSAKTLMKDPLNLVITGVGGQGNVRVSLLIGNALVRQGYFVTIGETYGASQRGGPVMSHVRVSKEGQCSPFILDGRADVILGLEPVETLRMLGQFGNPDVVVIVNPRPIYSIDVTGGEADYPELDRLIETVRELSARTWVVNATEEAQKMGDPIFANMILIGAVVGSGVLPLDEGSLEPVLREDFPKELEANMAAFRKGVELARE